MRISVLNHGYVEFIEAWGHGNGGVGEDEFDPRRCSDFEAGIIEAARQSTQGSFRGWEQDERLLKYLFEHKHATPFEFAGMVIEVQAPLFVFREWHRHRTQSYNEMSARYAPLPDLYYRPACDQVHARADAAYAAANKQQASQQPPDHPQIDSWMQEGDWLYEKLEQHYQRGLLIGVPKELARIRMPVGHYSRMRASANLRNWLAFLTLRMDPAAQLEIRQFAEAVGQIVAQQFPRTWALFQAGRQ